MKYLFLLLLPLTALAQFKVEVKNLKGEVTHGGEYATVLDAEKALEESGNAFGKPERTILKSEATADELSNQLIEEYPEEGEPGELDFKPARVKLKKTFTTTITDISAEKDAEKAKQERKRQAKELLATLNTDDLDSATTIAGLKSKLKVIFKALKETNED